MSPSRARIPGALILAATAALTVASCAVGPATAPASTGQAGTDSGTPKQRAEADVAAILASFRPPPSATRLRTAPGALKSPITSLGDGFQESGVTFWAAPGDPQSLLAWETAHLPGEYKAGDTDFGPPSWDRTFDLPPVAGVLPVREMVVEVTSLGGGQTGLRVDAHVGWQPVRTAAQQVPAAAKAVTITVVSESRPAKHPPGPATITRPATVSALAAFLNGLPVSPFNGNVFYSCPAAIGVSLRLTFRATPHGSGLASVQTDMACGVAAFSAPGVATLNLTENGPLSAQVLKIACLGWKLS